MHLTSEQNQKSYCDSSNCVGIRLDYVGWWENNKPPQSHTGLVSYHNTSNQRDSQGSDPGHPVKLGLCWRRNAKERPA